MSAGGSTPITYKMYLPSLIHNNYDNKFENTKIPIYFKTFIPHSEYSNFILNF